MSAGLEWVLCAGGWRYALSNGAPVLGKPDLGSWSYFCADPQGIVRHQPSKLWRHRSDAKRAAKAYCERKAAGE